MKKEKKQAQESELGSQEQYWKLELNRMPI